jgi:putative ABC transport system permease protein
MFRNYLAAALRNLVRNRLYAAVTIGGMAIAFASAILIGLYLRHELTYDRFIPGHDRVFLVRQTVTAPGKPPFTMDDTSAVLAADLKPRFPQIEYLARYANGGFPSVRRGDVSISERSFAWVDPDFFKILPLPAIAGDPAHALDAPDAIVITRSVARRYFGQGAALGGRLLVDGHPKQVTAVIEDLPSNSSLFGEFFASSLAPESTLRQLDRGGYSSNGNLTFVRLRSGASAAALDAGLKAFARDRLEPMYAKINPDDRGTKLSLRLMPLTAIHLDPADGGDRKPGADVKVLLGIGVIGALIVIVAAINFVTLMTARATCRAVEVGVRKALGAGRRDLVLQFMGEAMMYVGVALVLAIALAELLLPAANAALQRKMTFDYLSNPALLAAMLGVALVTGLLAAVYPAFVLSAFRPAAVLKGGPMGAGGRGGRVREILVVAQFAILVTLLLSTATIFRQTVFALQDATHIETNNVLMLYATPCTDVLRDVIRQVPGVKAAACSSPASIGLSHSNDMVLANGHPVMVNYSQVDFGFFKLYGVRPLAGRLFQADRPGDDGGKTGGVAPPVVINEAAVRALGYRSPTDAVGKFLTWNYNPALSLNSLDKMDAPYQSSAIIGVIPDVTFESIRQRVPPSFYYVPPKNDPLVSAALNVKFDPLRQAAAVRRIHQLWPKITHGQPVQQYFADLFLLRLYVDNLIQGGFIAVCALIAVSIACLGLFALSAFTAERRTKEIGVRKAMGASTVDILKLLLWQFTKPVIWATLIAWPVAFLAMRWWLSGFAYRVDQAPWTFLAAGLAAMAIAWATVFVHALNVARARPVGALRYE